VAAAAKAIVSDAFPCHPEVAPPAARRGWRVCPVCGTWLRSDSQPADLYGDHYPAARAHHDPEVGAFKARTTERWLASLGFEVAGASVCEIGFGGGACLAALQARGAFVSGLEPIAANRAHAQSLGIPAAQLFDAEPLPRLPRRVDLWLLQDSFEHVPDPNALARWMASESAPRARALLVAPDASSPSRKLMGPLWIHHVPDHRTHYTRAGVAAIFGRAGFRIAGVFRPWKQMSLGMMLRTALMRFGLDSRMPGLAVSAGGRFWFNLGEMGLWLVRDD
jgi:SAM-dependent methyltransferase